MNWIALITALIPLIEMLLKLFLERRPNGRMATRLRSALDRANAAAANLTPAERKKHAKLLQRLKQANDDYNANDDLI